MANQLTHWKKLVNPDYLGAYSLTKGESKILTIKEVTREMVKGTGGKSQECTVAHFKENEKPMILNRTNCKAIQKAYKTPFIEDWANKKVEIYAVNIDAFGEKDIEALRIKPEEPRLEKPFLEDNKKAFETAIDKLKKEETTLGVIKSFYRIKNEDLLMQKIKQ